MGRLLSETLRGPVWSPTLAVEPSSKGGPSVVPFATPLACLKVIKLSLREAKSLTQGHTAWAKTHETHLTQGLQSTSH